MSYRKIISAKLKEIEVYHLSVEAEKATLSMENELLRTLLSDIVKAREPASFLRAEAYLNMGEVIPKPRSK